MELAKQVTRAKQELGDLRAQWEARGKIWTESRKALEKEFEKNEKTLQDEIGQLQERLAQREQQISKLEEEQRKLNDVHRDTVALLNRTQAALKERERQCAVLKEECKMKLADQKKEHRVELKKREETFNKELRDKVIEAKQELTDLQTSWEAKQEAWNKTRDQLEEALQNKEKIWHKEMSQLRELAEERDRSVCRVEEEQKKQHGIHADTLALLAITQAALKQQEQQCASLKEECSIKLAEQEQGHRAELDMKEESFQNELSQNITKAKQELADLHTQWKEKEEAWVKATRKLEETLEDKEQTWKQREDANMEEIQLLHDAFVHLQVSCLYLSCRCF